MNNKNSAIFLATVLVAGVIGMASPFTAFAAEEYGYDKEKKYGSYDPYKPDKKFKSYDPYKPDKKPKSYDPYKPDKKPKSYDPLKPHKDGKPSWAYQGAECGLTNVNVNGIEQTQIQQGEIANLLEALNVEDAIESPEDTMNALNSNGNGNGDNELSVNIDRNIVNVCIQDNENNNVIDVSQEQGQGGVL